MSTIRALEKEENETCLVKPMGIKLLFNKTSDLPRKLDIVAESALSPRQKIEVLRSHLNIFLSHDL